MKLKPSKEGLLVRDPVSKKFLPQEGAEIKIMTTYWQRRLNCGDVIEVVEEPTREEPKKVLKNKKEGA